MSNFDFANFVPAIKSLAPSAKIYDSGLGQGGHVEIAHVATVYVSKIYGAWRVELNTVGTNMGSKDALAYFAGINQLAMVMALLNGAIAAQVD